MTATHRATSRRARVLAAVLAAAALVLGMVAWLGTADAAPTAVQATYAREGQTCTTTAAGYCTINHGLGTVPEWVGITNSGVALTGVDGKTSATFRVRFAKSIANNGAVTPYANVPVRFDWAAVYTPPVPEPTTPAPTTTQPPTSPPATTTQPPPTTTAPATTTPAPTTTVPPATTWPVAGEVGNKATGLTVVNSSATAPAGCTWDGTLVCRGSVTLDRMDIRGSVDIESAAAVRITNTTITRTASGTWIPAIITRDYSAQAGCTLLVADSTLKDPVLNRDTGEAAIEVDGAPCKLTAQRNDISGHCDGVHPTGRDSVIERNYIHDLCRGPSAHVDGTQWVPDNLTIRNNNFDLDWVRDTYDVNACIFLNEAGNGVTISSNRMRGGGFTLRNEAATNVSVTNNLFVPISGQWGLVSWQAPAPVAWSGNVRPDGTTVASP